ncbi:MAG: FAD-binding oxidoreductase [Pseudomonadota bacterium]
MNQFLLLSRQIIGTEYVLTDEIDTLPFVTDWRQRSVGKALAVLKPASSHEVAQLVKLCAQFSVSIVPQGGNTGLVLGSIPDQSGNAVVLSLKRMNRIREIDAANNTMTVEAGCLLAQAQEAAHQANRLFPLSLASEGTCTIGGNLSTNAGGTAVLRYGNARELCLGLEVVTASGEIWDGLRALRKDNTGYDLRDLFIGAEGTLGIITAAVVKLFPRPKSQLTAFAALTNPEAAVALLALAREHCGAMLTGFELMSDYCMQLVRKHFPQSPQIFPTSYPQYVLIELSGHDTEASTSDAMEKLCVIVIDRGIALDVAIANSLAQSKSLWQIRENISAAQAVEGKNIKHDISLPASQIASFISETDAMLSEAYPHCRTVTFGHLGDGNLHYNVSAPESIKDTVFILEQEKINRLVHDNVHRHKGSISAEHGLGALKKEEILRYKSPLEIQMMRSIKSALDPNQIMNPGKVI